MSKLAEIDAKINTLSEKVTRILNSQTASSSSPSTSYAPLTPFEELQRSIKERHNIFVATSPTRDDDDVNDENANFSEDHDSNDNSNNLNVSDIGAATTLSRGATVTRGRGATAAGDGGTINADEDDSTPSTKTVSTTASTSPKPSLSVVVDVMKDMVDNAKKRANKQSPAKEKKKAEIEEVESI